MSPHRIRTSGEADEGARSRVRLATSAVEQRRRDGSLAMLAGGVLLAWTARTVRTDRGRAILQALTGAALLGIGRRQRRTRRRAGGVEPGQDVRRAGGGEKAVSDEAHAEARQDLGTHRNADESRSVYQSETEFNPRGTSDRSDVQMDDGGDLEFVEGREPGTHRETHLEDERDTRLHDERGDEPVEVDLSVAAMADEASEAAGPHPEQAYPAHEGTDPEPMSEEAPPRASEGIDASAGPDAEDDRGDDESREERDESE